MTYDFPHKVRGLAAAEREITRLRRSLSKAERRGDRATVDYLSRRHARALRVWHQLSRQANELTHETG